MIQRIRRSRMFGWDRNPLRRRIDRVEAGMLAGLIMAFLIGAPLPGRTRHESNVDRGEETRRRADAPKRAIASTVRYLIPGQRQPLWARHGFFPQQQKLSRVRAQVSLPLGVAVVLGADEAPVRSFRDSGRNRESPAEFG